MNRTRLNRRLARRLPERLSLSGDAGSMAFYVLIAVVGMALGALVVPMVVTSSQAVRSDNSRVHALDAAQTGIQVMVGQLRSSQSDGVGTSTKLPCTGASGSVNVAGAATYTTKVDYYRDDPVTVAGATKMRCVAGYGTYDPVSGSFTPRYARITSTGKDGTASNGSTPGRTLQSTYVFKLTNTNIVGGRIRIYPAAGATATEACIDAGSASPIAGTSVSLQTCTNPVTSQQIWAYRSDLTLQLLSSVGSAYSNGLCLDTAAPLVSGNPVVLKACSALGSPAYSQQWSFNDNGNYEGSTANSATTGSLANLCLRVDAQSTGTPVKVGACGAVDSTTSAWIPSPAVGAGNAQAPQLINYYEFGRCLDVTGQQVGANHLIDYPCKQNPSPGAVSWNQKFTTPAIAAGATRGTGRVYTNTNSTDYCLTSPGASGGYVTLSACTASNATTNQTWTVYNGDSTLTYASKYTIVDSGGRCLGLSAAVGTEQWSSVDVEPCTGSTEQKWNAASDLTTSLIQNTDEIANP